jgi:hypothetical protein
MFIILIRGQNTSRIIQLIIAIQILNIPGINILVNDIY